MKILYIISTSGN